MTKVNESILWLVPNKAILSVYDVGMKLNLIYLSDDPNRVSAFGGEVVL
jgi:hypothetical protein